MSPKSFVDVFIVEPKAIPMLYAFSIKTGNGDPTMVGGKLAYKLRNQAGGIWVWANGQLISETAYSTFLREIWANGDDVLKDVRAIEPVRDWTPTRLDQAEFVARGILPKFEPEVNALLKPKAQDFGRIRIERNIALRGWVVNDAPAVSITLSSNVVHKQTLAEYLASGRNPSETIGLMAASVNDDLKGEIVEVVGALSQNREWLLAKTSKEANRRAILSAPDSEMTFRIETRGRKYIYIASALRPIVRMNDLERFSVDPRSVAKAIRFEPRVRYSLIDQIAAVYQKHGVIGKRFDSDKLPSNFVSATEIGFQPELKVGKGNIHRSGQKIMNSLIQNGLYSRCSAFPDVSHPIIAGVIDATPTDIRKTRNEFLASLKAALARLNFGIKSVDPQIIEEVTHANLERAIDRVAKSNPNIILVLFPGSPKQAEEDDDEGSIYHLLKGLTISRNIQTQVVYEDTFTEDYAMDNIVLGILAKTQNVPFVLAKPLPFVDIVVGMDIARRRKKTLAGSVSATAIARIYFSDGKLMRYVIHDAPIDGETIPSVVLRKFFPQREFQGKRVVVHRDGYFRGEEKTALQEWAKEIGATFYLVEVIKSGAPRLYSLNGGMGIDRPEKATAFKLNSKEAFLISSLPPFKGNTPRPLQIRVDNGITIEQALNSVLALTLLHYGSVREPRLPVTIHYSDKIAEFSLRGIKPKDMEGDLPFWL